MSRILVVGKFRVRLPDGKRLIINTPGPDIDPIARGLFWWGFNGYELDTARIFYQLAKKSDTTFDVGANIGYFSLLASLANRESHIVAFEPLPEFYKCLQGNIHVNHAGNVNAILSAVSNDDGDVILYVSEDASTSSTVKVFRKAIAEMQVPATTLDF